MKFVTATRRSHEQCTGRREVELLAEAGSIDRDEVKGRRGQHGDHHAENDNAPVRGRRSKYLARGRVFLHRQEFRRFFKRTPQYENDRDDDAPDKERDAPFGDSADGIQEGVGGNVFPQDKADDGRDEDGDLLAGRLKRGVEATITGGRDFGKINRYAAEFDSGGEALYQSADQHNDRRRNADRRKGRAEGDHHGAKRHERKRNDQALPAADPVDIGAEHDGADRAHQRTKPEYAVGIEQGRGLVRGRKERLRDILCVEAEQKEIELLEEIAAGCSEDGANSRFEHNGRRTGRRRH